MGQQQLIFALVIVAVVALNVVRLVNKRARKRLVREKLDAGARVVDVRTPGEFGAGHYPGAVNIPLDKLSEKPKKLGDKESSIIVYCNSGSRSGTAASRLRAAGFTDVVNGGGLSDLPK